MKFANLLALMIMVCALIAIPAHAAPIMGELNITGQVAVGATTIDWLPADSPVVGGVTTGVFTAGSTSTGDFASLAGTSGTSKDLDVTAQPVNANFSLPNFLTIGPYSFTLTFIYPGVGTQGTPCTATPGPTTCTPNFPPPTSPFTLTNTQVGSAATFTVAGTVTNTSNGDMSNFSGTYTTQFTGKSYQDLIAQLAGGGTVAATYSANFVTTPQGQIPEPTTTSLVLGGALLLIAGVMKRRTGTSERE